MNGKITISNNTESERIFIGQSNVFKIAKPSFGVSADEDVQKMLAVYPVWSWSGYFDHSTPQVRLTLFLNLSHFPSHPLDLLHQKSESFGWYENPGCLGERCLEQPQINVWEEGMMQVESAANVTFIVPVNLMDYDTSIVRLAIDEDAFTDFMSGGKCGENVGLSIGNRATYLLTGGSFLMSKTCEITGSGKLTSIAGVHHLAQNIEASITISGGTLLWPQKNGEGAVVTFRNGLLIEKVSIICICDDFCVYFISFPFSPSKHIYTHIHARFLINFVYIYRLGYCD